MRFHLLPAVVWLALPHAILAQDPVVGAIPFDQLLSDPAGFGFANRTPSFDAQVQELEQMAKAGNLGLDKCQIACALLELLVPPNVSSPASPDYKPVKYWSVQQSEVIPACRIDVASARDISTAIKVSKLTQCPFAVKGGGHVAFAGASSIQNGILINLANLNTVSVNEDRTITSVGSGNTWINVYKILDPLGLSVVGGREASVGVGGLTLGGGISYFSGRYGWACDNVLNYEVVLADGSIVIASPTSEPNLYWALRGGSGTNFGIISRFDLATFEQGPLWGGSKYYSIISNASLAEAFSKFAVDAPTDDFAHLYIAFGYADSFGGFAAVSGPTYGKPVADAPIFDELSKIPALIDATGLNNITALAIALDQTAYVRFRTVTFKNDANLIKQLVQIYVEETSTVLDIPGILPFFSFQPISLNIIDKMKKNGGNVLGLSEADGPLVIMNVNWGWSDAADDARISDTVLRFFSRSIALAKSMSLDHRFIYMNYAGLDQGVFAGYGEHNLGRLKDIQKRYDPHGVFTKLQPGYFKL
ncbi:uncharacterized protein BP5553_09068 [Venustampulla echinocandica]|uniref:FAD-binding PCMH-type domain-containing protein n=1 Tax=Venustampulla echinocandica TaxID=2656787 RepID=A0A370TDU1_9HELO|nr:uncharacterized protein BP5553_09068 [Venustampulla echinocandica]RDL32612.1 hypothetical protein BP5553_09068 [Venustampulla echinocandica]